MSYPELEHAMYMDENELRGTKEELARLKQYQLIRSRNLHKMQPIPVCTMPKPPG
jgi:hypothetical protein